jgi:hypothetical protein
MCISISNPQSAINWVAVQVFVRLQEKSLWSDENFREI